MKLEGIRVIDLSLFLPGPLATQFMADHGAEVIKVESIEGGEPNREIGPKRDGVSVYFANTHRGKQSLALNLKDPAGVEVLLRLAEKSDVLVEAFRPGVAERLGIGYAQVAARAPRIVYASIAAFGQQRSVPRPRRARPRHRGHDRGAVAQPRRRRQAGDARAGERRHAGLDDDALGRADGAAAQARRPGAATTSTWRWPTACSPACRTTWARR